MRQKDLHVVILGLQLGDLVWGKMETFHKWPALITCDPICGQFVYSELGYEVQYHVEFLGAKHSHAWIKGYCIELYSETVFKNDLSSTKKSKKKKSQISRNLKQYNQLQNAIKEANALVDVTNSRRMECCVFENADGKALLAKSQRKFTEYMEFPINKSTNKTCNKNDSTIVQICSKPNRCCIQQNSPSKTQNSNEQTEPFLMSCYNNTESNNSLLTLTPQQRLSFDIEVYKKSEVAFTVDLKQFLARNNLHLENTYWENVPVNTYQLFQVVNEFGGYEMVTQKAKWSNIYREITNTYEKYKGKLEKKDKSFILEKIQKKPKIVQHKPDDDIFCSLYQKFEELENANRMCYFEEEIKSAQKELGICIRFHDEPAPVCPLLEYKFPLIDSAFSDDSQAQIAEGFQVPDIFAFESHLDKYWTPNSSNHSKTDPDNASINLEDLHDLRDQIELISYEINQ
ncbi:unnamed protein product [Acanthosepion pharaonis]|uniref:Uncharacterized protein n=1 Tax=Acanthosepion pharaonis TaxID=158019 RepID=A0A812DJT5_ACAPH|nr:unnamed protein product [Sepia pharaonis]